MMIATVIALTLAGADAAPGAPHLIATPQWVRKPNPQDLEVQGAKPFGYDGRPGSATIECRVNDVGLVGHCKVLSEDPPHHGFGRWALDIAHLFKMKPETIDGKTVSGAVVRIPVHFGANYPTILGDSL